MTTSYQDANSALAHLCHRISSRGTIVQSRNGETKELSYESFRVSQPENRYISLESRKASLPAQIAETMWILSGRNDIKWLSNYLPRAADFSDDGLTWRAGYGPRIRRWKVEGLAEPVDQLLEVISLLELDPTTRRAVINIYDPAVDFEVDTKDVPCNNWLHFLIRDGKLCMNVATRSNDLIWGWSGINQFEWSSLLEIMAGLLKVEIGPITYNISSLHVYERHYSKAESLALSYGLGSDANVPRFDFDGSLQEFDQLVEKWFHIEQMIREEPRPSAWHHIRSFPEPMLKSWLVCLYLWWNRLDIAEFLEDNPVTAGFLKGTTMKYALENSPVRKKEYPEPIVTEYKGSHGDPLPKHHDSLTEHYGRNSVRVGIETTSTSDMKFLAFLDELHTEKDAVYGDSWKRRGEMLGIMANIARKMDRLGVPGAGDTASDTVVDLLIYLAKYHQWLDGDNGGTWEVLKTLIQVSTHPNLITLDKEVETTRKQCLENAFNALEYSVSEGRDPRYKQQIVKGMMLHAYPYAKSLWEAEEKAKWKEGNATRFWKGYDCE